MKHQKRLSAPENYPIRRKDGTYIAAGRGPHGKEDGIPVVVFLRDVLGYAETASEAREILNARNVRVNGRVRTDPNSMIGLMDVVSIDRIDKSFRVLIDEKGFVFREIEDDNRRLYRVVDRTTLSSDRTQLNLDAGENIVTDEEYDTRGSVLVDLDSHEIEGAFPLEEGNTAFVIGGSHAGEIADIVSVEEVRGPQDNIVELEGEDGTFETVMDFVFVVGGDEPEVEV